MDTALALAPSQRQILVNVGNRYVVFGPVAGLPQQIQFDPNVDAEALPRVADEESIAGERIVQTLRVAGMRRVTEARTDRECRYRADRRKWQPVRGGGEGPRARSEGPRHRAGYGGSQSGREGRTENLELWYFNIDRLKLLMMRLDHAQLRIDELVPLDVWEKTSQGVFTRNRVVEELDDWVCRITQLYNDVCTWLADRPELRPDQSRTVTVSEELMQDFAVTDREVPVLDPVDGDQAAASFVPRGLWMIGSWGRIDIITRDRTYILSALKDAGHFEWWLTSSPGGQTPQAFDKSALLALLSRP